MRIPFNRPYQTETAAEFVGNVLATGYVSGGGTYFKECQKWFHGYHPTSYFALTHSCTASLEVCAMLLDLQPGDEVIMPSFTFVTSATAFVLRGAVPVFVDVDPNTMNIDTRKLEQAITPKTKAIVPVHYAGMGCEMDAILAIAKAHNLCVVEDAAQGMFSEYQGQPLGTIGALGCYSFHETKNITCGEGGGLYINDPALVDRTHLLLEKGTNRRRFLDGQVDKYTWQDIGSSYLPSELNAAMLLSQLNMAAEITRRRYAVFAQYHNALLDLAQAEKLTLPYQASLPPLSSLVTDQQAGTQPSINAHIFFFFTRTAAERTAMLAHLSQRGIGAIFHYIPLHSSIAGSKFGRTSGSLSVTDDQSARLIRLPLYATITPEEVAYIAEAIHAFYA